jgi:hypothetical protein
VAKPKKAELHEALLNAWEYFDDYGDGAPDAALWQRRALNLAAKLKEVLAKAGIEVPRG